LRQHACIQIRRRINETPPTWRFRERGVDLEVRVAGTVVVDDARLALRAALDGAGIAMLAEDYVRDELASGLLKPLLEEHSPLRPGLFLYYPSRKVSPALKALRDFLLAFGSR
jgi:DNA-binding transcriptional LysR family regulator